MLRLIVILVSVFALSKVASATGSAQGSAETTPATEVSKDAALQDDAEKGMNKKEEGKGSKNNNF